MHRSCQRPYSKACCAVSGSDSTALVALSATLALSFQKRVRMPITLMKLQILKRIQTHTLPLAIVSLGGGTGGFDRHVFFCSGACKNIWGKRGTSQLPVAEKKKASWHNRLGCLWLTDTVRVVPGEGRTAWCLQSTPDAEVSLSWKHCYCSASFSLLTLQPQQESWVRDRATVRKGLDWGCWLSKRRVCSQACGCLEGTRCGLARILLR